MKTQIYSSKSAKQSHYMVKISST